MSSSIEDIRDSLNYTWVKTLYWELKWPYRKIAAHLGVSASWMLSEIERLDLKKSDHNVKYRGKKGFAMSEEQRVKRRIQPNSVQVISTNADGLDLKIYPSVKSAAKINNVQPSNIRRAIREPHRRSANLKWAYAKVDLNVS